MKDKPFDPREGGQYRVIGTATTEHLFPEAKGSVVTLARIDVILRAGDPSPYDVIYWCRAEGMKHALPLYMDEIEEI